MLKGLCPEEIVQHDVDQGAFLLVQDAQPVTIWGLVHGCGQALVQPIGDQVAIRNLDVLLPKRQIGQHGAFPGQKSSTTAIRVLEPAQTHVRCQPLTHPAFSTQVVRRVQPPPLSSEATRNKIFRELVDEVRHPEQIP